MEHFVVIPDGFFQKITGVRIEGRCVLRVFLVQNTVRFLFVCAVAVDQRNLEPPLRRFRHLALKLRIIQLCRLHGGNCKNGIEAADPLLLLDFLNSGPTAGRRYVGNILQYTEGIGLAATIGFLVKVGQDIVGHQTDALRR